MLNIIGIYIFVTRKSQLNFLYVPDIFSNNKQAYNFLIEIPHLALNRAYNKSLVEAGLSGESYSRCLLIEIVSIVTHKQLDC